MIDLVDTTEIARRLKVRAMTVHQWRYRNLEFPEPLVLLVIGPVWEWSAVEQWARNTGRLHDD